MCLDSHVRIETLHGLGARSTFGVPISRVENHLALQVRQRHVIIINHAKHADAGGGQIEQHRCAKAAGADDQHARSLQLRLAGTADLAQHDVTGVAFEFFCIEHCG